MIGLVVGGWFASAAIAKLKDLVSSYAERLLAYHHDLEGKVQKLESSLNSIQAVVDTAEQAGVENPSLARWLGELKDAVFDAEDVLDLFNYRIIESQVKASGTSKVLKCMKKDVQTCFRRLVFQEEDINKLIGVTKRFEQLGKDINNFLSMASLTAPIRPNREQEWRQTTPISVDTMVYGRGKDMEKLLNLLESSKDDSETKSRSYGVIAIVGIGGVGKTTLAQLVYNLPQINSQFDVQAWVCVSTNFNIREVFIKIIESAGIPRPSDFHQLIELGSIQRILQDGLRDKRFLIVLDDVWNEVTSTWENLAAPFRFGKKGSRVLVTTRSLNVARKNGTNQKINLETLEDEDFLKLFTQCAFGDENPKDFTILEAIGKKISQKLGGLPLAAKTVGSVLRNRIQEEHWYSVLENKLWKVDRKEDGVLVALELSFSHLPAPLKQCFVYCALFPKGHLFKRDDLLHYWVALGYVHDECDGSKYFDELESRFFFQKYKDQHFYVIHDLLHDLAEYICQDEICRVETDDVEIRNPKAVHHLYVSSVNLDELVKQSSGIERLHSLVIDQYMLESHEQFQQFLMQLFRQLKGLRILIYYGSNNWMKDLPFDFRVHLRYFKFKVFGSLPQVIYKLYHLQVIDIVSQSYEFGSQFSLHMLINLRYLKGDPGDKWSKYRIGQQTSLQQLEKAFTVGRKEGHRISELKNLRQLRGSFCIQTLDHVGGQEEAKKAELHRKKHLDALTLSWRVGSSRHEGMASDEGVIEGLQPHPNLKSLKLLRYAGVKCPFWLEGTYLPNLQAIELEGCSKLTAFSPFGQLPFLKFLKLKNLDSLESVGVEIYGENHDSAFPLLETLELSYMEKLTTWSATEDGRQLFPCLRKLIIDNCPKLMQPMPLSASLKEFEFLSKYLDISSFTNCLPAISCAGLHSLSFGLGHLIEAFTDEQEEWFQQLASLKEITFAGLGLKSLPSTLRSIASLNCVKILGCQNLQLAEHSLPDWLGELHVKGNGEFIKRNWHKISYIPIITREGKPIYHPVFVPFAA